jgi:tetratricopeptide (TPR) repeat protein
MPKSWGSVARRGAHLVRSESTKAKNPAPIPSGPQAPQDEWIRVDEEASTRPAVVEAPRHRAAAEVPGDVATAIRRSASTATAYRRERLVEQMGKAAEAYSRNRFEEAARLSGRLANEVPDVPEVRELAGLSSYRSASWRPAARHLEAYRTLSSDAQYIPLEMDCQRGIGRVRSVSSLFETLRQESPGPDVLAEGRLVLAGSLADRGKLHEAIELLESTGAGKPRRNPSDRHLRQWYFLGELYDRSGDLPRARQFFSLVAAADPEAYDVKSRLKELGPTRHPRSKRKTGGKKQQ